MTLGSPAEQVLSDPGSNDVSRVAAYVTLTIAQAMTGDCDGLDSIIEDAVERAGTVRAQLPFAVDQIQIMNLTSMISAGRISEAIALAEEHISRAERGNVLQATWLNALCLPLDVAGRHATAAEAARQAIALYSEADPFGLEPQARGLLALELGQQGDVAAARSLEGLVLSVPAPRLTAWVDRGRAWSLFAQGETDEAIRILTDGGRRAVAGEHFVWSAFCFHDVARLGSPRMGAEELRAYPRCLVPVSSRTCGNRPRPWSPDRRRRLRASPSVSPLLALPCLQPRLGLSSQRSLPSEAQPLKQHGALCCP